MNRRLPIHDSSTPDTNTSAPAPTPPPPTPLPKPLMHGCWQLFTAHPDFRLVTGRRACDELPVDGEFLARRVADVTCPRCREKIEALLSMTAEGQKLLSAPAPTPPQMKPALMHWRIGRESRACDGSSASPAFATRDTALVTCPRCRAQLDRLVAAAEPRTSLDAQLPAPTEAEMDAEHARDLAEQATVQAPVTPPRPVGSPPRFVECTEPPITPVGPAPRYDYQRAESFGHDAIVHRSNDQLRTEPREWAEALTLWRALIDAEQITDVSVQYYRSPTRTAPNGIFLRATDGALLRKSGGAPQAIHMHAWRQLVSLLAVGQHERGMAGSFAWLTPPLRAQAFAELVARSTRREGPNYPILFRSHRDLATGLPALRAVLSGIHSGQHFDDLNIAAAIGPRIKPDAPSLVWRGLLTTYGWASLAKRTDEAQATIHWENSEVGAASLRFWAGCRITVLDAHLRFRSATATTNTEAPLEVSVATANGASSRRHVLARKGLTEDDRRKEAIKRIGQSFDTAALASETLAEKWAAARLMFPAGWNGERGGMDRMQAAAVILDLLEERAPAKLRGTETDREQLKQVLCNEERLKLLPFGSAAHIAGAFACVARSSTSHEDRARLQELAGDWVTGLAWGDVR